jgi:hypothetical protein
MITPIKSPQPPFSKGGLLSNLNRKQPSKSPFLKGGFPGSQISISPPLGNGVAIRHPGQVRPRRTRAGIQKEYDCIEPSLDSGYPPPADSGMTQS